MQAYKHEFLDFALDLGVLRFGEFTLKSGRQSPYFFNTGLFNTGGSIGRLGQFYAQALLDRGPGFDMLYGPAYKGIPLATSVAIALAGAGRDLPWAFNRKEAKDHGEGGQLVGAPLQGRVLVVDDVISAGTSVRESVAIIEAAGASLAGVAIALDRQERGNGDTSAVQQVATELGVPVVAVATLDDLVHWLESKGDRKAELSAIRSYRERYGA